MHHLGRIGTLERGARTGEIGAIASVISRAGIRELDRLNDEAELLVEIRARTGLKISDCCPVAASQAAGARLATFDARVARVAASLGIEVLDGGR